MINSTETWPFWLGGAVLASIPLLHLFLTGRMMSASGHVTALWDRLRPRERRSAVVDTTDAAMVEALAELSAEELGLTPEQLAAPPAAPRSPILWRVLFLGGVALGGLVSALAAGRFQPELALEGERFAAIFSGASWLTPLVLIGGGVLIGFGTRMAGGCTSGHGLCGTSRLQTGSLLNTFFFFGTGIAVAFLLEAL